MGLEMEAEAGSLISTALIEEINIILIAFHIRYICITFAAYSNPEGLPRPRIGDRGAHWTTRDRDLSDPNDPSDP